MSKDLPINLDNTNDIYRRQASLGGNKITRSIDNTEGNTTLVWGRVTQVYYQKGTCDFKIQGQSNIFVDNSGSDGTLSAPIPVDYYGKNYDGHPFIKTRLIQKGNKVLVAFVNGSTANPVIIGVYPDNSESYELLSPALDNKISDNTEDTNYRVNNEIEITPANQMIYKSGDGSWAKSMQGRSFLIVQGNKNFELEKVSSCYENIPYFYKDNASDEPVNYPTPVYSENTKAPEWLLVHEGNWELDGSSDKHRTRFYVNQEGELQIVFFTLDKPEELLVVDGNKDTGFTIMKQYDSDTPMDKNSKNYVKFNVGDNNEISMSVSPSTDSKEQAQSLEIKSDGIYVNGKLLTSLVGGNQGSSDINVDDVKDIINSTTGIEDWDKFKDTVHKAAQDAQQAADEAKKAGDAADAAGQDAAQAGLDAKLAGENAAQKVSDLKDKMLYYLSLSPEKDLYVPGKYLILNEDVTIKNGFIKEGYIDDAAINSASIKDAAITSAKIKDLAVYSAKIANAAITNAKIADLSVGTAKIRDLAVTDEKVGKLTFNHMIGETLDANLINVTNLTADSIKAHSITADKITIGNLGELSPNLGNITGGSIDAGNVNIDNLPADDPNILTPDKKVKLRNTVDTLQEAVKAQNDFQNSVGAPSDTCNTLNMNMSKLIADTTPLLRDMHSNSEYDHKLIDNDIDNVNIELNNLSHKAITTIGKTADGKNTIYTGAFAPSNPHIGDIWAKPSDDGSNEGTFEIYGQSGWFSPTKDVYNRVQSQINNLPKSYYQGNEPTGDIVEGSMWYKPSYDALGNVTFTMYVYHNGAWKAMTDANIEGVNAAIHQVAQTADGKNKVFSSDTQPNSANVHEGDLWFNTKNNSIYVYHGGTWTVPNASAQAQIDSAISKLNNTYYQANQPTGNIKNGDIWYKTITNSNGQVSYELYVYQNGNWVPYNVDAINGLEQKINQIAQTADGKNAVFASGSAPSNPVQGDIWIDTSANNTIKVYINGSWQTTESQNQKVQDQVNNALNGIPKVYYQSTQPTGTINEGSTWYKTSDNNTYTMYTYKNGQWVGLLDDNIDTAVSDATNTINNTINSNVNNLNNSINGVKDDIDNLDFGGRNLLLQSQARDNGAYYLINGAKQNETFLGANVYEQHSTWQGQEFKLQNLVDRNVINTNDEYVFSTYVKYTGKNPGNMIYFFNADNTIQILNGENGQTAFANTKPNVWNQISIHIKFNSTTPPSSGKFYAGFEFGGNNDHSVTTYWACPKLEKGSKATDYSIAPEDVDSSLSANQNAINQTTGLVNNSVQISQSYNGVTIDDKDGITINAGNNRISLNANVGIDIWGNSQHNMKLDTNGNLIMRGNLVAGNISGVTFSGNAMQLQTGLAISGNGAITVGNDVSINASQGLVMNKGSININNNTLITNDGTLITKKLLLNNSAQILNKESGRPVITLDNNGNATFAGNLNVVNINGNNGNLNGVLNVKGGIKSNGVYLSNSGLSISNGNVILGRDVTVLAAVGAADINGAVRSITGGWIQDGGAWAGSAQDCGFRIVPIRANHQIMVMLGAVPDLSRNQMAWYDSNQHFIRRDVNADFSQHKVSGSSTMYEYLYTPPSNAAYLSFSTYVGPSNVSQDVPIYIYEDGNVNLIMTNDGTLIAQSAIISGTVTSNNVNITGGSINLVKPDGNVAFHVDSTGNAVFSGDLSGVNIKGNNSTLYGMLAVNGTISAASGNVIMNNDGLTINKGSINIGNGNGTTFMVKSDGSLLSNNATITGNLTARKLTIANDADDIVLNANGNFILHKDGSVYAVSLTLKNGTINSSNMYGSSIIGSTLKLADTYLNEFYNTQLSRTQYDEYGLRSGYTLKGANMNRHGVVTHAAGVRERSMNYLAMALSGQGWLDGSGNVHETDTDIYTLRIQQLLALNDVLHIRFTNGPSNVFTNGGTRRIIFYDSNNNVISSYESSSNSIDVTPPPNAYGFKICVYVGNNGYTNWLNAIRYSELTNTGNYMDTEDSVIAWQGDSSNPGYDICSFNYGTTDASQLNVTRDNMWVTALQFDSSQLSDGDIIKLEMEINYDNSYYKPGGQFWLSVNGKSMNDSNPYFGSTNLKYAVVGNYKYVWYFTYHSDLGNHIIINLNMQGMQSGSRFYITDTKEVLHSTRNPNYYGTNNVTEGAMNVITQDGKIRQTYDIYQTDGSTINSRMRDVQQYNGYFTLQAQSRLYNTNNNTINEGYNDFSAIYMSGDGLSFVGDFNKHYTEPFMYSGALTASSDNKWQGGAAITLWGNISHETLLEHDFQYELGSGLVIDIWGNFHLMYSSVSWNVNDTRGVAMLSLDQRSNDIMMGNMFGANVPGVNPADYSNGNNHIFKFEGSNGHITLGRMWMSTFGDTGPGEASWVNANVSFDLVGNGWFCFQKGIATYDGTVHTISDKNTKYDIELLDNRKSIQAIQNTDFARFHYKSQHNRAESYQKGVIIDNSNEYSVDNSFVDDNGKTLNIMNLVATLADVVKEQQKQISELNAKVAYLEINK